MTTPELATTITATEADRLLQAEALVRDYCGWHIAPSRTDAVYVQPTPSSVILLPSLYVTAIVSVSDPDTSYTVDDYTFTAAGAVLRTGWWWGANTTVTFTHGYATPPADVTAVVQAIAQRAVDNPHSFQREQVGPFGFTYPGSGTVSMLDSERDTLRRYRVPTAV